MNDNLKNLSDEEYVVQRAKLALVDDPVAAKAWMLTAKTLYPNNFAVQFEAYKIEKCAGHVKEAAKYFGDLLGKFQQEREFWKEIEDVTNALRAENDLHEPDKQFLCEMFKHLSLDMQHQLLLFTADRCEDTVEHCKLLLLLLQKFPKSISTHGPRLVDTLLSAEKHSHTNSQPVNNYRKLLICDLLPLLGKETVCIEFTQKLIFKLLHKAIEFYLYLLNSPKINIQETRTAVDDPWKKLYGVLELTGRYLGWENYLTTYNNGWTKEGYWQKILTFCQTHKALTSEDPVITKQLLYCLVIFFLHCLYDYSASLTPEACPGQVQTSVILVEAFTDGNSTNSVEPKPKRRKCDTDANLPIITIDKSENKNIISNFTIAVNCWDLISSSEHLQKEFSKLNAHIKNEDLLKPFLIDYALYKSRYDDALARLQQESKSPHSGISKTIRLASILYLKRNFGTCFEQLLLTVQNLPEGNPGNLSTKLTTSGKQKHLHFLPLTQMNMLQYCVKILFRCIRENLSQLSTTAIDLGVGHLFVLMQLDWPQEEEMLVPLLEQIRQRGTFSYIWFQSYIINVDILEELTYLWSEQGGQVSLDILPHLHLGQRRIGTRGSDKGAKEEIRMAIKRQIARSNEPLAPLLINFIINERGPILQTMI